MADAKEDRELVAAQFCRCYQAVEAFASKIREDFEMSFEKKVAIVTGGGTGIGQAIAAALVQRGASVVLVGRRGDVLQSAAKALGSRVQFVTGDVGVKKTSTDAVTAAKGLGGLDFLVNAAGIFKPTGFLDHTEDDLDAYINTILKGTFLATQAAVPALEARGGGAIVNIGSMWALQAIGATPSSAYSAAKAGVHALTKNLALELAPKKIRINTVAPAVVRTPVYDSFVPRADIDKVLASFDAFHPLGRIGTTKDVTDAALFMLSDEAAWITGTVLPVDGGVTAGRS